METLQVLSPTHTLRTTVSFNSCRCSLRSCVSVCASFISSRYIFQCPFTCWLLVTCSLVFSNAMFSRPLSVSLKPALGASLYQPFLLLLFIHCLWAYLNELPLNIKSRILTSIKAQMNLHARTHAAHTHTHTHTYSLTRSFIQSA